MFLKSPRAEDIYVSLTSGHAIRIGPEGRDVPEMFRREAFAEGAIPADMKPHDFVSKDEEPSDDSKAALLVEAVKKMLEENNPDDFTGAGLPNRKKISALAGWSVSVQELSAAWEQVNKEAQQ